MSKHNPVCDISNKSNNSLTSEKRANYHLFAMFATIVVFLFLLTTPAKYDLHTLQQCVGVRSHLQSAFRAEWDSTVRRLQREALIGSRLVRCCGSWSYSTVWSDVTWSTMDVTTRRPLKLHKLWEESRARPWMFSVSGFNITGLLPPRSSSTKQVFPPKKQFVARRLAR